MKLENIGLSAIAAAIAVTSVAVPSQAADLFGQLDIAGSGTFTPTSWDFAPSDPTSLGFTVAGTDSFSSLVPGAPLSVFDVLDLSVVSATSPVKWLDFANDDFDFFLTSVVFSSPDGFDFEGVFGNASQTIGTGDLRFTLTGGSPRAFGATVTAVPTPALLPGLLGFGATVLRKRKKAAAIA